MYRFKLYHPNFKTAIVLGSDPFGWDAERKTIERDPTLHGVFVKYTPDLKFVKDGRSIITELYNTYGIEAEITLTVELKNGKTRQWEQQYEGRLDLTTLKIDKDFAQCKVDEIGFYQKIKNRQEINVSMQATVDQDGNTITPGADATLSLHSKALLQKFKHNGSEQGYDTIAAGTYYFVPSLDVDINIDEIDKRYSYPVGYSVNVPTDDFRYHFKIEADGVFDFVFRINFGIGTGALNLCNLTADWYLVYGTPGNYTTTAIGASRAGIDSMFFLNTLTLSGISLVKNSEIYIYCRFTTSRTENITFYWDAYIPNFQVEISGLTTTPASAARAVYIYETWERLIRNISSKASSFKSDYYGRTENGYAADGAGSLRAITNGDQLRGFEVATNPILVNAKELMETCRAIDGVGMGLEKITGGNRVVVEPLSFFYKNTKSLRLSNVYDIKRSVASEYYYNEVEVGYRVWNNRGQQTNNLDEVNSKRTLTLPISQLKKKLSLISPYIAAGYILEFIRRSTKKTTDTERDKDNFVIQLRRNAGLLVPEKNEGMTITGVIDAASSYNARLTPMQNLIRNGRMLASGLFKVNTDSLIKLSLGEGNNEATTQIGAGTVVNEKSVAISQLGPPLYVPEYYEFVAAPSRDDWAQFEQEPYGYVEFSSSTRDYVKGWLVSAKPDAESNRVQFKLLAAV